MKNTNKIIIAIAVAIAIAATVLVVTLVNPDSFSEEPETKYSIYTLEPTKTEEPSGTESSVTESWVDLNAMASDLATTTEEPTSTMDVSETTTLPGNLGPTVVIYVDQNGNIIDPNNINNNKPTTDIDATEVFDTESSDSTTEPTLSSYEIDDKGMVTKYFGDSKNPIIKSVEQGKTVKGIANGCFQGSDIKTITLPATVTYIGEYAFADCKNLKTVSFVDKNATVTIGPRAFQNCVSLTDIVLPKVKILGNAAFVGCTALESVALSSGSEKIDNYCFQDCKALTELSIPKSVTIIGKGILNGCDTSKIVIYCAPNSEASKFAGTEIETKPIKSVG